MKLYDLLDKEKLDHHIREGFVGVQRHPTLPLRIYNYTHLAQYDGKAWGDGTIDYCRGLIVDNEDNVVARPFKKFHNLNTAHIPETMAENLPTEIPEVSQKMDGSLGIWYDDGTDAGAIATRGSFTSPQALWATKWWKENGGAERQRTMYGPWAHIWTPLFEIIYPENRIVVDYKGFKGLVCIGGVYINSGKDVSRADLANTFGDILVPKVYLSEGFQVEWLAKDNTPNEEGYVATYSNGTRVKIKFEDYVKLHRIITGMNAHTIWEGLKEGKQIKAEELPPHVLRWYVSWMGKLMGEHAIIRRDGDELFANRPVYDMHESVETERRNRARRAAWFFQQRRPELKSLFFAMLDGRNIEVLDEIVWDMIEPRGDDRSFQPRDIEEG